MMPQQAQHALRFAGYAALFDRRDTGHDLIRPRRINTPEDLPAPPTLLAAFELPHDPAAQSAGRPRLFAALSSAGANWSGAALYADRGDGQLDPLGGSGRRRAVMGTAPSALPPGSPLLFDRTSSLAVTLVDPRMNLVSATTRQLAEGANLALLGEELLQFAEATALGEGRWRLVGFLRGCGGTESAVAGHAAGEPFVLLDGTALALDPARLGTAAERKVLAMGRGDAEPVVGAVHLSGLTLRPLAPVHPRAEVLADGTLRLGWTRRARGNWTWQDGIDAPLVEQAETYLLAYGPEESPLATWTLQAPRMDLPPDLLARLSALAPGAAFSVRQQGTYAVSARLHLFPNPSFRKESPR